MERLAPTPRGLNGHRSVWLRELLSVLAVPGRYKGLCDWWHIAPAQGQTAAWIGEFNAESTAGQIVAYLAANSVSFQDADDAVAWARRAAREWVNRVEAAGGFSEENPSEHLVPLRNEVNRSVKDDTLVRSREWYEERAVTQGAAEESLALVTPPNDLIDGEVLAHLHETAYEYGLIYYSSSDYDVALTEDGEQAGPAPM
jgi:hypothetical protein